MKPETAAYSRFWIIRHARCNWRAHRQHDALFHGAYTIYLSSTSSTTSSLGRSSASLSWRACPSQRKWKAAACNLQPPVSTSDSHRTGRSFCLPLQLLPVPMRMHKNLGYTLVLIGVVQLCCIVAHEQVGWGAPCCHAMRQAHAFSWWLSATWLMVMALCLYTKDGETQTDLIGVLGQEASLASISPQKADEIVWSLFALTILITVVIVSLVAQRVDAAHEGEAASGEPPPRAGPVGAAPHALDPLERDVDHPRL